MIEIVPYPKFAIFTLNQIYIAMYKAVHGLVYLFKCRGPLGFDIAKINSIVNNQKLKETSLAS